MLKSNENKWTQKHTEFQGEIHKISSMTNVNKHKTNVTANSYKSSTNLKETADSSRETQKADKKQKWQVWAPKNTA